MSHTHIAYLSKPAPRKLRLAGSGPCGQGAHSVAWYLLLTRIQSKTDISGWASSLILRIAFRLSEIAKNPNTCW